MQRILVFTFVSALLLATASGSPALAARPSDACLERINELTGSTRTETVPVTDHDVAESSSVSHGDTKAIEVSRIDEVRGYLDTRHCNGVTAQELVMLGGSWVYIDDVEGKRIQRHPQIALRTERTTRSSECPTSSRQGSTTSLE